jgi:hypothetical protein
MPDQKFIVGYKAGDKVSFLQIEATSVTQYGERENRCWKISGDKGILWMSSDAFLYAFPAAMYSEKNPEKSSQPESQGPMQGWTRT